MVDVVVTHDLAVTFTDDQLNAQIQLRRTQNGLDEAFDRDLEAQTRPKSVALALANNARKKTAVQLTARWQASKLARCSLIAERHVQFR